MSPDFFTKVFSLFKGSQALVDAGCAGKVSARCSGGIARSSDVFNLEQWLEWLDAT